MELFESPHEMAKILYSVSNFAALPIERNFQPDQFTKFANDYGFIPIVLVCAYILMICYGPRIMDKMAPFEITSLLAGWNFLLSLFSFLGMFRTVPFLMATILSKDYKDTVCTKPTDDSGYGTGPVGFWVMLFIYSKVPELIDTVFIVLRKKKLIFLHWYHHITVLLYCWHAFATLAGTGLYFVAMNYSVHAVMYGYYCLQALKMVPPFFPIVLITIAQITQMFVGTGVCMSAWYYKLSGITCYNETTNLIAGGSMYASYLYLFCDFAFKKYLVKGPPKEKKVQ